MTDVPGQAVLTFSMTTNVSAQPAFICRWEDFCLCFEGVIAGGHSDDCRRGGFNNRHTRTGGAGGDLVRSCRCLCMNPLGVLLVFMVAGDGDLHRLSYVLQKVAFPSRAEFFEGHCALLRTSFTVSAPGFAHCAAAYHLGVGGRQRVIAAPVVGCYPEALTQRGILNTSISLQDKTRFA